MPIKKGQPGCLTEECLHLGIHAFFDSSGKLDFLESFCPETLSFRGQLLVGRALGEVLESFASFGYGSEYDCGTHILRDAGIALFADEAVLSAGAFREGYY